MPATKAQNVILEILRNTDGEWSGKTKLFKAFYLAHLYYATDRPGMLTDWPIARMPEGPGIDQSKKLFDELLDQGLLTIEQIHEGPYPEHRYRLTDAGKTAPRPPAAAQAAIEKAATFCHCKTRAELSELTHELSRSWKEGKDGDLLNIYIDTMSDEEYEACRNNVEQMSCLLPEIFEGQSA